ncbi:MAG: hypothetical protein RIM23_03920 [Coleofasciculus sp. G3-WIS-01]|uniref:hypothetical protein n=1 Tax=Coleofasciculus sp. G3-WIS-01 TaxID=3069528 RepID=UPI0032FE4A4D
MVIIYVNNCILNQEKENNPQMGFYRQEGIVLKVETQYKGFQWKFKPPSMEEYHRLSRVNICPITLFHSIWKMVDHGEDISLTARQENMAKE